MIISRFLNNALSKSPWIIKETRKATRKLSMPIRLNCHRWAMKNYITGLPRKLPVSVAAIRTACLASVAVQVVASDLWSMRRVGIVGR